MTIPTPVLLVGLVLALLALVALWKLLLTAGAIIGLQWVLITNAESTTAQLIVLAVPALLAAVALSKVLHTSAHHPVHAGRPVTRKEVHQ